MDDLDHARFTALTMSLISLFIQTIIYYGLEVWRRYHHHLRDSFYYTPGIFLVTHMVLQTILGSFYLYRCLGDVDNLGYTEAIVILMFQQTTIFTTVALAASTLSLFFSSIRSLSTNMASTMHLCTTAAWALWLQDPFAICAAAAAAMLACITPPRTYKLKNQ